MRIRDLESFPVLFWGNLNANPQFVEKYWDRYIASTHNWLDRFTPISKTLSYLGKLFASPLVVKVSITVTLNPRNPCPTSGLTQMFCSPVVEIRSLGRFGFVLQPRVLCAHNGKLKVTEFSIFDTLSVSLIFFIAYGLGFWFTFRNSTDFFTWLTPPCCPTFL